MEFTTSTYQKIGVVYGILVILVLAALGIRYFQAQNLRKSENSQTNGNIQVQKPTLTSIPKPVLVGKLSLAADKTTVKAGVYVDVTIYFEAPGKTLDGTDVILRFNPQILSALGFSEGTYFKLVPRKDVDNTEGVVKITALDSSGTPPLTAEKVALGKVSFQAQKEGVAQVSFDYTPGTTAKTTLTEYGTSQNILREATGINITVEP